MYEAARMILFLFLFFCCVKPYFPPMMEIAEFAYYDLSSADSLCKRGLPLCYVSTSYYLAPSCCIGLAASFLSSYKEAIQSHRQLY